MQRFRLAYLAFSMESVLFGAGAGAGAGRCLVRFIELHADALYNDARGFLFCCQDENLSHVVILTTGFPHLLP